MRINVTDTNLKHNRTCLTYRLRIKKYAPGVDYAPPAWMEQIIAAYVAPSMPLVKPEPANRRSPRSPAHFLNDDEPPPRTWTVATRGYQNNAAARSLRACASSGESFGAS